MQQTKLIKRFEEQLEEIVVTYLKSALSAMFEELDEYLDLETRTQLIKEINRLPDNSLDDTNDGKFEFLWEKISPATASNLNKLRSITILMEWGNLDYLKPFGAPSL